MKTKIFLCSAAVVAITANAGWAMDLYGSLGVTGQINHVDNIVGGPAVGSPTQEPFDFAQYGFVGTVGSNFANGYYGQIDLRFQATDVPNNTDDTLHDGATFALRAGKDFGTSRFGGFLAYVNVTADDSVGSNKMQRLVLGIDGEHSLTPNTSVFGEIGGIGGPRGTQGSGGDDGIHDAVYALAGVSHQLSPSLSLEGQLGFANGTHDNDELDVKTAGIGVNYQTKTDGLSTFLRADYTDFYQHGEDEGLASTTIRFGLTFEFGANTGPSKRPRSLAPYEDWLGYSGGHLE